MTTVSSSWSDDAALDPHQCRWPAQSPERDSHGDRSGGEGKGVLIVLNEQINSARDATKTNNFRAETLRSPELGCATGGPGSVLLSRLERSKGRFVSSSGPLPLLTFLGTVSLASRALISARPATARLESAVANDNRTPGGTMVADTLALRLTVTPVAWHLLGDSAPAFTLLAFAEEGKAPSIPGPLIRVRVGTPVRVTVRNPLDDTLVVRGLSDRVAMRDSLVVLPRDTATARFVARREGTYLYWVPAYSLRMPDDLPSTLLPRRGFDSQLAGAIVVDPPGPVPEDRIFVITALQDRAEDGPTAASMDRHGTLRRQFNAVNGRAWPHTERLRYALGDSVRWRIVNASQEAHPMHLHGFYFRVDAHGAPQAEADSIYAPEQRRMAVTETVLTRNTASITWSPDRPGGWLFHCHLTNHAARFAPIDRREVIDYPSTHHDGDPDRHAFTGMNGLVVGITIDGKPPVPDAWR